MGTTYFPTLTIAVLSVITAATYGFSAEKFHNAPDAEKRNRVEELPFKRGLIEVLADDDPRKPQWPIVDVIAVHGLGSEYPRTWMKDGTMWLKDILPYDLPRARILAFIYPSEPFNNPDFVDFRSLGGSLLRSLVKDREGLYSNHSNRPLIFIGHSFGGLVIKKALVLSQVPNPFVEGDHSYIADATCGVVFLGTPHFGSQYASAGLWKAWALGMFGGTYNGLLKTLELLSPELEHLNQDFLAIPAIRKLPQRSLVCFYETKGMLFGPVVDETSACLSIAMRVGLNVNHKDMNKFSDREGPYDEVKYCLQRIYDPLVKSELTKDIETYQAFTLETTALGLELSDPHPNDVSSKEQGNVITNTYEEQSWLTSLEWNLGLVTLSIIVLSVVATTTYCFSAKKSQASDASDAKKRRRRKRLCSECELIEVLADGDRRKSQKPVIDIIAVQGLGSNYPLTWIKDDTMWLKDFLPDDLPHARILAFTYPSEAFVNRDFVDLQALGDSLLQILVKDREDQNSKRQRPIIFIGHSFGGLVIKKALALSKVTKYLGNHSYIADATRGVLFLGTPHFDSQYTSAGLWKAWVLGMFDGTYNGLLKTLKLPSAKLQHLNQGFLGIPAIRKLPEHSLVCFYEMKGMFGPVVDEESACLSIGTRVGLSADHKDINKFSDRKGPYDDVIYCLQRIYEPVVELEMKTKNPNDSEYHHSKGGLIEVLADGDRNKSQMPVVDIVAVQGLGSNYPLTWTKDDTMWLKDFLPDDLPRSRILAFSYPSEPFNNPDFVDLRALGGSLLRSLAKDRECRYSTSAK